MSATMIPLGLCLVCFFAGMFVGTQLQDTADASDARAPFDADHEDAY